MPLGGVIFLAIAVAAFGTILLFLAAKLSERSKKGVRLDPIKLEPYECGLPAEEKRDTKISVKFYLTAILFIVFDIEIIFMYPWATSFREMLAGGQGSVAFYGMMVFLAIFIFGLVWEIKSKALEWD